MGCQRSLQLLLGVGNTESRGLLVGPFSRISAFAEEIASKAKYRGMELALQQRVFICEETQHFQPI